MAQILDVEHLNVLPSKAYYLKLEKDPNDYCAHEDKYESVKSNLERLVHIKDEIKKILNSFCKLSYGTLERSECEERCDRLYYWIGDMIVHKINNDDEFNNIFKKLQEEQAKIGSSHNCKCKFLKDIKKNDFISMKVMYDYSIDHSQIISSLRNSGIFCDKSYMNHIQKSVYKYKEIYDICTDDKKNTFCDEFKKFYPDHKTNRLPDLKCKLKDESTELTFSHYISIPHIQIKETDIPTTVKHLSFSSFKTFLITFLSIAFLLICIFLCTVIKNIIYIFITPMGAWIHKYVIKINSIRNILYDITGQGLMENKFYINKINTENEEFKLYYYNS
ncbi:variable surface protein [Plasmodium gonderi]|uniref:Variable surface protein n=1 Tax=Plasmodium gonderi TaxID=77519 RepID=A0A1Y1JNJ9_PLAGO|nr:variable surface protein [Plasmodium gonderi]GAW84166.1 variable surface protein [Plasmodium gonderi]